ncbi:MAG: hypothetical protein J2P54_13435 [Bradyrhizobiaceae bacterium]|nr:hypothetical protein [Bradyrhizobiaceae bacterium]
MFGAFVRIGVLSLLPGLMAGCMIGTTQVSEQLSSADLRNSGKSVLVVSGRFISTTMSTKCQSIELRRNGDGRTAALILATYFPGTPEESSGSVELDPGTWVVTSVDCPRGNTVYVIEPADDRGLATIRVGAGEVIDGGNLVVIELFQPKFMGYFGKSHFSAIVRPHAGRATAALNPELARRLVSRPMTAVDPPGPDVLARMCEFHREAIRNRSIWFYNGGEQAPLCQLIGDRSADAAARSSR